MDVSRGPWGVDEVEEICEVSLERVGEKPGGGALC